MGQSEYDGYLAGVNMGWQRPDQWPDATFFLHVLLHVFTGFFVFEILMRMLVYRRFFFYSQGAVQLLNLFDLLVVAIMAIDLYLLPMLPNQQWAKSDATAAAIVIMRVARIVKMLRTIQVLRALRLFTQLRSLVMTVFASLYAFFWSMVLLAMVVLMGALILCQTLSNSWEDDGISDATKEWIYQRYGTAGRSYYTTFEFTFSGGWPGYARTLVEEVSVGFAAFFMLYISLVVFAIFRIITALFIKDTLAAAGNDTETMIHEKMKEKENYVLKLLQFFEAADATSDGLISLQEFEDALENPKIKTFLTSLDLDTHEFEQLFHMIDDGDGHVSVDEFLAGALRLKGTARSQDLIAISHNMSRMLRLQDVSAERLRLEIRGLRSDMEGLTTTPI